MTPDEIGFIVKYIDDKGFIPVDRQMRTNVAHIFAIGDIVGGPMLGRAQMTRSRFCTVPGVLLKILTHTFIWHGLPG